MILPADFGEVGVLGLDGGRQVLLHVALLLHQSRVLPEQLRVLLLVALRLVVLVPHRLQLLAQQAPVVLRLRQRILRPLQLLLDFPLLLLSPRQALLQLLASQFKVIQEALGRGLTVLKSFLQLYQLTLVGLLLVFAHLFLPLDELALGGELGLLLIEELNLGLDLLF